ncbi:MAG: metal-dependent hydrolase [Epsilonproteobacteria bacterium]|nr:metal-dependent hydrolase [Campylobacterota bacterium]
MNIGKRYTTNYGVTKPLMKKVFRWKMNAFSQKKRKRVADDDFKLKVNFIDKDDLNINEDFIIWLGHATFYIQLDGIKILCDPVFGDIPLVHRLSSFPINPSDLKPDIILISHGHYDHLDMKSLAKLDIYDKKTKIIMPSNLSSYIKKSANITELAWYEEKNVFGLDIISLPASHWHRRGLFDFNKALWCSFIIKSKSKALFFAGDTAFDSHFEEIKQKGYGVDIALMPIGAYKPIEIMKQSHLNPQEALDAAKILGAKIMIPYHFGTFKLADEPIGEPHTWIKKLAKNSDIKINILDVGEIYKNHLVFNE